MLNQFYRFNRAAGIVIQIQPNANLVIDGCLVGVNKQQLDIEKKFTGLKMVSDLKKHLSPRTLVALNLSGKGVLTKQIDKTEEINLSNFSKILPNANIDDFYIQHVISGNQSFVSVIRKAEADKWFVQLQELGYPAVVLSLGAFAVNHIIDELNVYGEEIIFDGNIINRNEQGEWLKYSYNSTAKAPFKIKIQNEAIDEKLLLPYAAAFQVILSNQLNTIIKADAGLFDGLFERKLSERKLKINASVILLACFLLLLVNLFLFSWLETSNNQLNVQLSRTIQNTSDLKNNSNQIKEKESILQGLGWDGNINKSVLVDELAAILPSDIQLKELTINPVSTMESQTVKSIVFFNNQIKITGSAERILSVNEWIARIKTKEWIKSAQLGNYAYNNEINTGGFSINIVYQ